MAKIFANDTWTCLNILMNTSVLKGPLNHLVEHFSVSGFRVNWPDAWSVRADVEASEQLPVSADV